VIREGQGTAQLSAYRSLQSFKQILRVAVGNRKTGIASEGLHIFQSQALCVFGGSYVRGERIAGWMGISMTLPRCHAVRWTPRSLRENVASK